MVRALSISSSDDNAAWWVLDASRPFSVTVGRSPKADLTLPGSVSGEVRRSVSRVHVRIFQHDGDIWLEDLHSHNFTFVNSRIVFDAIRLPIPCKIRLGGLSLRLDFCEQDREAFRRLGECAQDASPGARDVLASTTHRAEEWEKMKGQFRCLGALFDLLEAAAQARRGQELVEMMERGLTKYLQAEDVQVDVNVPWSGLLEAMSSDLRQDGRLAGAGVHVAARRSDARCVRVSSDDETLTNWVIAEDSSNGAPISVVRAFHSRLAREENAPEVDALLTTVMRLVRPMLNTLHEVERHRAATPELLPHKPSPHVLELCRQENLWGTSARHLKALYYAELGASRYFGAAKSDDKLSVIFFLGETGTGKSALARIIHKLSDRSRQPFCELNCAAIPVTLAESELFGYEKGAHDKAFASKPGWFELASTGTLFLDEIGKTSTDFQSKLLKVLDSGEYCRLGGNSQRRTNCRVILATSEDPEKLCRDGLLLYEFWYRVGAFTITIAPLRERAEDVTEVVERKIEQLNKLNAEERPKRVSPRVMSLLRAHLWPGNLRELVQCLEVAYALAPKNTDVIDVEHLPERFVGGLGMECAQRAHKRDGEAVSRPWDDHVFEAERYYLVAMIAACDGNLSEVARRSKKPYQTIHNKLNKLREWARLTGEGQSAAEIERLRAVAGEHWRLVEKE